ncbi:MAG: hypothetical protein WKF89_18910, partial [Chitinophagaceae bacterium]
RGGRQQYLTTGASVPTGYPGYIQIPGMPVGQLVTTCIKNLTAEGASNILQLAQVFQRVITGIFKYQECQLDNL